ncbi:MAG: hypothetical protein WEB58_23310 [Planctomycetaceae bacterium]
MTLMSKRRGVRRIDIREVTPQRLARLAGLRYVCDSEPGLTRRRCGGGFIYVASSGGRLSNGEHLTRIRALAIPPAWTEVWICLHADGHLQATGHDNRGRKQYLYHERWHDISGQAKYSSLASFGKALPRIRQRIEKDLRRHGLPREKVAALAVRLLDETAVRIGNREYATDNESYGLTTLERRHAQISGSRILLSFVGKGGKQREVFLRNARLAKLLARCRNTRGKALLQYEADGRYLPLTSEDVNHYLGEIAGSRMTAKLFRTWRGSTVVADYLYRAEPASSESARKRIVNAAIRAAAEHLGNTPAICRKSYVHPQIIDAYLASRFPAIFKNFTPRRRKSLSADEQVLLHLLSVGRGEG